MEMIVKRTLAVLVVGGVLLAGAAAMVARRAPSAPAAPGEEPVRESPAPAEPARPDLAALLADLRRACERNDKPGVAAAVEAIARLGSGAFRPCLDAYCESVQLGPDKPGFGAEYWFHVEIGRALDLLTKADGTLVDATADGYMRLDARASSAEPPPRYCTALIAGGVSRLILEHVRDRVAMSARARDLYARLRTVVVKAAVLRLIADLKCMENREFLIAILRSEKERELVDIAALGLAALGETEALPDVLVRLRDIFDKGHSPSDLLAAALKLAPFRVVLPILYQIADADTSGFSAVLGSTMGRLIAGGDLTQADKELLIVETSTQSSPARLRMLVGAFGLIADDPAAFAVIRSVFYRTDDPLVADNSFDAVVNGGTEADVAHAAMHGLSRWPDRVWADRLGRYAHRHPQAADVRRIMEQGAREGTTKQRTSFIRATQTRIYRSHAPVEPYREFLGALLETERDEAVRAYVEGVIAAMDRGEVHDQRR